jgi:uroporphyrinogen-III decarboxylase
LMGALDVADILPFGDTDTVKQSCGEFIQKGIQILAPGCSVAPFTPRQNLVAMTQVAKAHAYTRSN